MADRYPELSESDLISLVDQNYENKLDDRMMKQLLISVITKYRDLSG